MIKWYFMDKEYNTYKEVCNAFMENVSAEVVIEYIVNAFDPDDILSAIEEGNMDMTEEALEAVFRQYVERVDDEAEEGEEDWF